MTYVAGEDLSADELNITEKIGAVIARGKRESTSTPAATEQSVMRVDDIPFKSGHAYWVGTNSFLADTTAANDVARVRLRMDVTGADATTASTQFANWNNTIDNATDGNCGTVGGIYVPAGDETGSVLITTVRQSGTGNISIVASATAPLELFVIDLGFDPGDTGVDL